MSDENRGTGLDPAWNTDLTGGNDSGTAKTDENAGNEASGPDMTARLTQGETLLEPDKPKRTPMQSNDEEAGNPTPSRTPSPDDDTVTDESGRIAPAGEVGPDSDRGGARDASVTGHIPGND